MSQQLVTKIQFSRIAQIVKSRVTTLTKERLREAVVDGQIDIRHETVQRYLRGRIESAGLTELALAGQITEPKPKPKRKSVSKSKPEAIVYMPEPARGKKGVNYEAIPVPEHIRDVLDKTLHEILRDFGTDIRFLDWVKACKTIEDVHEKRVKTAKIEGEFIPRALVETHIFAAISDINTKLLSDSVRTMTARALEANEAGESREAVEAIIRGVITSQLKSMKRRATEALERVQA